MGNVGQVEKIDNSVKEEKHVMESRKVAERTDQFFRTGQPNFYFECLKFVERNMGSKDADG